MNDQQCCVKLNPADWDKQTHQWQGKPFYKTKYWSIFHIPLNFGSVMTTAMSEIEKKDCRTDPVITLSKEESMFSSTLLITVKEGASDIPMELVSGKFLSMIFEGDYKNTGKWLKQMKDYLVSQNLKAKEFLFWYATCPKCTKELGGAQTVIFARIE